MSPRKAAVVVADEDEMRARETEDRRQRVAALMNRLMGTRLPAGAQSVLVELNEAFDELCAAEEELVGGRQTGLSDATLQAEHRRYVELFEGAPEGYLATDPRGIIQEANRAAARLLRVEPDLLVGESVMAFVARPDSVALLARLADLPRGGAEDVQEWVLLMEPRDDGLFPAAVSLAPVFDPKGALTGFHWLFRDASRPRQAAAKLGHHVQRLTTLDEIDRAALALSSVEEMVETVLPRVQRLVGSQWASVANFDLQAGEMTLLVAPAQRGLRREEAGPGTGWIGQPQDIPGFEALEAGRPYHVIDLSRECPPRGLLHSLRSCGLRGYLSLPLMAWGTLAGSLNLGFEEPLDLTGGQVSAAGEVAHRLATGLHLQRSRQAAERRLSQLRAFAGTEALLLAARLGAAFAHEINNPLQTVVGCLGLAQEATTEGVDVRLYLEMAQDELRRAVDSVSRFRDVNRHVLSAERTFTDINQIVAEALAELRARYGESDGDIDWCPGEGTPRVLIAVDEMRQALVNLMLSATDGMPTGHRLEVSVSHSRRLGEVCVTISGSGVGAPTDALPGLMGVFHGTQSDSLGLGLYVGQLVVAQHGGRIEVRSQPGRGTTITVCLPTSPLRPT